MSRERGQPLRHSSFPADTEPDLSPTFSSRAGKGLQRIDALIASFTDNMCLCTVSGIWSTPRSFRAIDGDAAHSARDVENKEPAPDYIPLRNRHGITSPPIKMLGPLLDESIS